MRTHKPVWKQKVEIRTDTVRLSQSAGKNEHRGTETDDDWQGGVQGDGQDCTGLVRTAQGWSRLVQRSLCSWRWFKITIIILKGLFFYIYSTQIKRGPF